MIAYDGGISQHTGTDCVPRAGHAQAGNVSIAGNMPAGPAVVQDTLACWLENAQLPFAERFLTTVEAAEAAGDDKHGRQAAGLLIHSGQSYPLLDLCVDDHGDPLSELRRLMDVARERCMAVRNTMPTVENFSDMIDRTPLDAAIATNEKERAEKGMISRSFATSLT